MSCAVDGCERAIYRRGICRAHNHVLMLAREGSLSIDAIPPEIEDMIESSLDDGGDMSLADDSAVSSAVVIDLSGGESVPVASDAEVGQQLEQASLDRNCAVEDRELGTAHPEVILWLAQRHAAAPSRETLALLRQAVGG